MIKKIFRQFIFFWAVSSSATFAAANLVETVTMVNHFDENLTFYIGVNHETVPGFPSQFTLDVNHAITSIVHMADPNARAYVHVESASHPEKNAFLSISGLSLSGYLSHGIAYSWDNHQNAHIIFCTPEAYKKQNHC